MINSSSLIKTKEIAKERKKVSWNRNIFAEVKYECYIPFHIRCSSYMLQQFTKRFDNDSAQYLRGIMKRKNLSRIYATSNEEDEDDGQIPIQRPLSAGILRGKRLSAGIVRGTRLQKRDPSLPSGLEPFRKEHKQQEMLMAKNFIRKKQCTLDYFTGNKTGNHWTFLEGTVKGKGIQKQGLSPLPSCIKPFRKEQRHEMAAEGKRILVQKQDQCLPHRINPFRIEQKQEITAKNIAGNRKGSSRKKQCTLDYFRSQNV
jgi:hypothetical protein